MEGEYYLHENGSLIYKPHGGVQRESAFVRRVWAVVEIAQTPDAFVEFLAEARSAGAREPEIVRLADHNKLDEYRPDWRQFVFGGGPDA